MASMHSSLLNPYRESFQEKNRLLANDANDAIRTARDNWNVQHAHISDSSTIIDSIDVDMIDANESDVEVYIVLDTNILIHSLPTLKKTLAMIQAPSAELNVVLLVPGIVVSELDHQKNSQRKIAYDSRKASDWLATEIGNGRGRVKGQAYSQTMLPSGDWRQRCGLNNDELILDCCKYFSHVKRKDVIFCTSDNNLAVHASSNAVNLFLRDVNAVIRPRPESWDARQLLERAIPGYRPGESLADSDHAPAASKRHRDVDAVIRPRSESWDARQPLERAIPGYRPGESLADSDHAPGASKRHRDVNAVIRPRPEPCDFRQPLERTIPGYRPGESLADSDHAPGASKRHRDVNTAIRPRLESCDSRQLLERAIPGYQPGESLADSDHAPAASKRRRVESKMKSHQIDVNGPSYPPIPYLTSPVEDDEVMDIDVDDYSISRPHYASSGRNALDDDMTSIFQYAVGRRNAADDDMVSMPESTADKHNAVHNNFISKPQSTADRRNALHRQLSVDLSQQLRKLTGEVASLERHRRDNRSLPWENSKFRGELPDEKDWSSRWNLRQCLKFVANIPPPQARSWTFGEAEASSLADFLGSPGEKGARPGREWAKQDWVRELSTVRRLGEDFGMQGLDHSRMTEYEYELAELFGER